MRSDAERNRLRVLAAANELFAERGLAVALEDVADRAGVGIGTLYRRFPDRTTLIEALFEESAAGIVELIGDCLHEPDPWLGLQRCMRGTCETLVRDRGLREVLLSSGHGLEGVSEHRARVKPLVAELVARAAAAGALRPGVCASDVLTLLVLVSTVADMAATVSPTLWERYYTIFVDGLRARPDGAPLPVPPLDDGELVRAMGQWCPSTLR